VPTGGGVYIWRLHTPLKKRNLHWKVVLSVVTILEFLTLLRFL